MDFGTIAAILILVWAVFAVFGFMGVNSLFKKYRARMNSYANKTFATKKIADARALMEHGIRCIDQADRIARQRVGAPPEDVRQMVLNRAFHRVYLQCTSQFGVAATRLAATQIDQIQS